MSAQTPFQRDVHGILLLDKPQGLSSNKALQMARRIFGAKKAGHTGSLDPLATGLLPICFGEATKIAGILLGSHKAYECECLLGTTTNTDDAEGEPILRRPIPDLNAAMIDAALAKLRGRIIQVPPIFSAIKQNGVPLYRRARRGEETKPPSREVEVFRLELQEQQGDRLRLYVECGSGTYVRSLVRDLGEHLGCGAHVVGLRRLWVDPFTKPTMLTLDQLQKQTDQGMEHLDRVLLPVANGLAALPALLLNSEQSKALYHGVAVQISGSLPGLYQALDPDGQLLALAELKPDGCLKALRGFNLTAKAPH